jgi:hypothetical protein
MGHRRMEKRPKVPCHQKSVLPPCAARQSQQSSPLGGVRSLPGWPLPRRRGIQRQNGESHDLTLTAVFFLPDSGAQLGRRPGPYERAQSLIGCGISYARESWKSNVKNVAPDPGTPRISRGSARARNFFFTVRARMTFVRGCPVSPTSLTALAGAAILLLAALLASWPRFPAEPVCKCRSTT